MKARGNYVERKKMGIYVLACRFMATLCVESNKSSESLSLRFRVNYVFGTRPSAVWHVGGEWEGDPEIAKR